MTNLLNALREKYASPAAVVRALGLDEAILREPKEDKTMPKTTLSEAGKFLEGIRPLLAHDASLEDLLGLIDVLKAANITPEAEEHVEPDGDEDDEDEDSQEAPAPGGDYDDDEDEEDNEVEPNSALPLAAGENKANPEEKKIGTDNEPAAALRAKLEGKLTPEDMAEIEAILAALGGAVPAKDEEPAGEPEKKEDKPEAIKTAMDAAIKAAVQITSDRFKSIRQAEHAVRPYVGALDAIAFDSAEGVYRHALKVLGVKGAETIHASALPAILEMQPKPGSRPAQPAAKVAMDAKAHEGFASRFPNAARIQL